MVLQPPTARPAQDPVDLGAPLAASSLEHAPWYLAPLSPDVALPDLPASGQEFCRRHARGLGAGYPQQDALEAGITRDV